MNTEKNNLTFFIFLFFLAVLVAAYFGILRPNAENGNEIMLLFTDVPVSAKANSIITIGWKIESRETKIVDHTALHYGPSSVPNPKTPSEYPKTSAILSGTAPGFFNTSVQFDTPGRIFLRAHVIIDAANFWSPEVAITVTK